MSREYPQVAFFLERGGDSEPAEAVCARCIVREERRHHALEHGEEHGTWGGLAAVARLRLLGRRRAA